MGIRYVAFSAMDFIPCYVLYRRLKAQNLIKMTKVKKEKRGGINFFNCDNIEFMKSKPDNYYTLAIVDPPYGLGKKLAHAGNGKNSQSKFTDEFLQKNWDEKVPPKEYFKELFRVSKNQIIWGGNYFDLPPNRGFIIWDKMVYIPTMSQIEQAWVSEDRLPKLVKINNTDKDRIHLTQKPIDLYRWILKNYAKEGFKILDTHGGSFTNAIACDMEGFDLDIIEIDGTYFDNGVQAFDKYKQQLKLF
jgi:site-specific DNA-methyltransferase (adenine-specific)